MEQQEMIKSLTSVIDEVLNEIEDLKKSDKFKAQEINLESKGPGSKGLDGKQSTNGSIENTTKAEEKEDKDKEKEDKDKEKEDKDKEKDEETKKTEGVNEEKKGDDKAEKKLEQSLEEGAFYRVESGKLIKTEVIPLSDEDVENLTKKEEKMEKNDESDQRFTQLEEKLSKMTETIQAIAEQPVERNSVPADVKPLQKSEDQVEQLSKSQVTEKLLELKKSGTNVLTDDICKVETGGQSDLQSIAQKYNIK